MLCYSYGHSLFVRVVNQWYPVSIIGILFVDRFRIYKTYQYGYESNKLHSYHLQCGTLKLYVRLEWVPWVLKFISSSKTWTYVVVTQALYALCRLPLSTAPNSERQKSYEGFLFSIRSGTAIRNFVCLTFYIFSRDPFLDLRFLIGSRNWLTNEMLSLICELF